MRRQQRPNSEPYLRGTTHSQRMIAGVLIQHRVEVLRGGVCVPQMELDSLPFLEHFTDGKRASLSIYADNVANEVVA